MFQAGPFALNSSVALLDFAGAMLILNIVPEGSVVFFLDNFLTSLDNTGSTVYKNISLVYGRVLSGSLKTK